MLSSFAPILLLGTLLPAFALPASAAPPAVASAAPVEDAVALGGEVPDDPALLTAARLGAPRSVGAITDIGTFLDQCPTQDPVYPQLRSDFELLRNGVPVGAIPCSEPVSAMPVAQYSDELIVVQSLRAAYYMDIGRSGHLPWTPGTFYAWMRGKIGGIDIVDGGGDSCCHTVGGRRFMTLRAEDDFNRDFDKTWAGISGNIALFGHETRHADGFPHVSCCGIAGGCDQTFDLANLSPYGIQWFLSDAWLTGDINVGFACLPAGQFQDTVGFLRSALGQFSSRFCSNSPPADANPAQPGGPCPENPPAGPWLRSGQLPGFEVKVRIGGQRAGTLLAQCIPETMCIAGALPDRAEVFVRVVGPKPNGYLWPTLVKFSTSTIEVWIRQLQTGVVRYYRLPGASGPDDDTLPGLFDRTGFKP